jgi:hypothetical protein
VTAQDEEIIVPFPAPADSLGLATEVRSTLIASSIESLRRRGAYDRYAKLLAAPHRDTILMSVAGQWLPMSAGIAHYRACEALGFSVDEQFAIGAEVSHKIHDTFLGVVVKMAKNAGVTPWTLLPKGNQLYGRLLNGGGGTQVTKLGPKECRAELAGLPLLEVPYFRNAIRGIYQAAIALFCARVYVNELPRRATPTSIAMRVAWV